MKNKMFKMSLILLFSIFSSVKSRIESGLFDKFNQSVDEEGFIDPEYIYYHDKDVKNWIDSAKDEFDQPLDKYGFINPEEYMYNFTNIRDFKNRTIEDQGYNNFFKYAGYPFVKNNKFLTEELLHNFNKWGDWDLENRKNNIKNYNYSETINTFRGTAPWKQGYLTDNPSGRSNYDRFKENLDYNQGNLYYQKESMNNYIPSYINNRSEKEEE